MRAILFSLVVFATATFQSAAAEPADKPVSLVIVGDIMVDLLPGEAIARGEDPFADVADILDAADFAIGNLECVVAEGGEKYKKPWNFRAHPRVLPVLAKHLDAVNLANNHAGDYGDSGLVEMLDLLKKAKIPSFGAGRNVKEARAPLLLERHGIRIAILGYNEYMPRAFEAGENDPGVAWSVDEHVLADIQAARVKHKADVVIPYLHWGWEREPKPDERQQQLAKAMIDAGASLVVGGHPHVTQGHEVYKEKLIVYSLGNFIFDGFEGEEANTGWMLRLTLNRQGLQKWDTVTIKIDKQGFPRLPKAEKK